MAIRSPFPGMDPYLEQHWRDVHHNLITFIQGDLNEQLPDDLRARVEERVFVESAAASARSVYPDVRVVERPERNAGSSSMRQGTSSVAVAEPLLLHMESGSAGMTNRKSPVPAGVTLPIYFSPSP